MMEWNEAEGEGTGWMDVCMYVGCGGVTYQYWEVRGYGVRRWRGIQYSFFLEPGLPVGVSRSETAEGNKE